MWGDSHIGLHFLSKMLVLVTVASFAETSLSSSSLLFADILFNQCPQAQQAQRSLLIQPLSLPLQVITKLLYLLNQGETFTKVSQTLTSRIEPTTRVNLRVNLRVLGCSLKLTTPTAIVTDGGNRGVLFRDEALPVQRHRAPSLPLSDNQGNIAICG